MTASELYKIVRDVPREAWPRGVGYSHALMSFEHAQERTHTVFDDEHAEAMFVGSMTAWLVRQEWRGLGRGHLLIDELDDGDVAIDMQYVELDGTTETYRICDMHASSLVAALSAACIKASLAMDDKATAAKAMEER